MTPGFYLTKQNEQRRKRKGKQRECIFLLQDKKTIDFIGLICLVAANG